MYFWVQVSGAPWTEVQMTDNDLSGGREGHRGPGDREEAHDGRDHIDPRKTSVAAYGPVRPAMLGPRAGFDPGGVMHGAEADEAIDYMTVFRRLWRRKILLSLFTL